MSRPVCRVCLCVDVGSQVLRALRSRVYVCMYVCVYGWLFEHMYFGSWLSHAQKTIWYDNVRIYIYIYIYIYMYTYAHHQTCVLGPEGRTFRHQGRVTQAYTHSLTETMTHDLHAVYTMSPALQPDNDAGAVEAMMDDNTRDEMATDADGMMVEVCMYVCMYCVYVCILCAHASH
jgi:hypothetical protein